MEPSLRKQQAYALIIPSIFNIHLALLVLDARQQHCLFFLNTDFQGTLSRVLPILHLRPCQWSSNSDHMAPQMCFTPAPPSSAKLAATKGTILLLLLLPLLTDFLPPFTSSAVLFFFFLDDLFQRQMGLDRAPLFPPQS